MDLIPWQPPGDFLNRIASKGGSSLSVLRNPQSRRLSRRSLHRRRASTIAWRLPALAVVMLALMALSFIAGWLVALGPVHQALIQLHRDIRAVNARRPLIVHPINFWVGLVGFVMGMLVLAVGNHLLRGPTDGQKPSEFPAEAIEPALPLATGDAPSEGGPD